MKTISNRSSSTLASRCKVSRFSQGQVWLIAWLAIAALLMGRSLWSPGPEPRQVASAAPSADPEWTSTSLDRTTSRRPALSHSFCPIESLRVGDRVVADNPDTDTPEQTAVDPATWRLLRLYAEDRWPDGTLDTIHIETLQSPEWMALFGGEVGAMVPPPLDLVEMGLPDDLPTTVVAVEPCPRLQSGPGRLVLTTVNHLNNDVWELSAVNAVGVEERLRPTGLHKFYSETRQDWVSTQEIHDNEVIRGRAGPLTIVASQQLPGTTRVYNLTVEGEHVYYVSELGLLAHNNGCAVDVPTSTPSEVIRNKVQGGLGEDAVRTRLQQSKVFELVGEQIKVRTPGEGGHRITDFVVRSKRTGRLSIIEVKTGNATRDKAQLAKDAEIANPLDPTTFFGRRARAAGFPNNTPTGPIRTFEVNASNLRPR